MSEIWGGMAGKCLLGASYVFAVICHVVLNTLFFNIVFTLSAVDADYQLPLPARSSDMASGFSTVTIPSELGISFMRFLYLDFKFLWGYF